MNDGEDLDLAADAVTMAWDAAEAAARRAVRELENRGDMAGALGAEEAASFVRSARFLGIGGAMCPACGQPTFTEPAAADSPCAVCRNPAPEIKLREAVEAWRAGRGEGTHFTDAENAIIRALMNWRPML